MVDLPDEKEEIWVSATEGSHITGYHRDYLQKLARKNWKLPDHDRLIRVRKRAHGYDIWLPDLWEYIQKHGYGPQPRKKAE